MAILPPEFSWSSQPDILCDVDVSLEQSLDGKKIAVWKITDRIFLWVQQNLEDERALSPLYK